MARRLHLPAGTRRIEFFFAGLSYLMPQKIIYRYRLDGFGRYRPIDRIDQYVVRLPTLETKRLRCK